MPYPDTAAARADLIRRLGDGHEQRNGDDGHPTAVVGCPWCVADNEEGRVDALLCELNPDVHHELVAHTARWLVASQALDRAGNR